MMSVSCATSTAHSTFEYLFQLMPSPLHTSQEESKDAVVSETLDLLVNFAHAFEEDGVTLDDTSGDGPVEGATLRLHLHLHLLCRRLQLLRFQQGVVLLLLRSLLLSCLQLLLQILANLQGEGW